jgi:hypothetical protein
VCKKAVRERERDRERERERESKRTKIIRKKKTNESKRK